MNVLVKIQGQQLIFNTEKPIKITDVFVSFKNDTNKYPQVVNSNNKHQFSITTNDLKKICNIYFNYYQYDKGIEYKSVSKFDDIVVMENE